MKNIIGRIIGVLFFVVNISGWNIYNLYRIGHINTYELYFYPLLLIGAFWFGSQYDKARDLAVKLERNQLELKTKNTTLENIFNSVDVLFFNIDLKQNRTMYSRGLKELLDSSHPVLENPFLWNKLIHSDDNEEFNYLQEEVLVHKKRCTSTLRLVFPNGEVRWMDHRITPILNEQNEVSEINGILLDVTERILLEQRINHLAYHDYLTDLPNRMSLVKQIEKLTNEEKMPFTILFVDFDNFKSINDYYGHYAGDQYLKEMAYRMQNRMSEGEYVYRLGGDEFVLLTLSSNKKYLQELATQILIDFELPITWLETESIITPSIGIATYPEDGEEVDFLITNADQAMYQAKAKGKNRFCFYSDILSKTVKRRSQLETEIKQAIRYNQLFLVYQPKIDLKTGNIYSVEALLRWNHPTLGFIPPDEFIPLAEKSGAIKKIGYWIFEEGLNQLKKWYEKGFTISMSLNVSPIQLLDSNFIPQLKGLMKEIDVPADLITLEITESVMKDITKTQSIIESLHAIGIKLAIDDFGKGYSSLYALENLAVDYLKIDRSFVNDMMYNSDRKFILDSTIRLGHHFNMKVIAEGVEEREQVDFLKNIQCDLAQGYYFHRPLIINDIEEVLNKQFVSLINKK